jgi:NAD(P)-dependent dehydrogenase (short-subunit alcohol dehydrogenase family)
MKGRVVVIVGSTTGIGLAAAQGVVAAGGNVVGVGKDPESCRAAGELLGDSACIFAGDARDQATVDRLVATAVERFGRMDGLLHVAGGSGRKHGDGPLHELTDEGIDYTLDLNLRSVLISNRAAVREFLRRGEGGVVVNVASVLAYSPSPTHFDAHAYAAAKAGIIGLTISAAAEYAPNGARFNCVAPGLVDTPMAARAMNDAAIQRFVATKQPLDGGRPVRAEEVAAAALFLLSDAARFITGQVLAVDGGWSVSDCGVKEQL